MKSTLDFSAWHGDPALFAALQAGRRILMVARNSQATGEAARRLVINEFFDALEGLLELTGFDLRPFAPTREELDQKLHFAELIRTKLLVGNGTTSNRFVVIPLLGGQVVFFLSTGSGSQVSDDCDTPFAKGLTRMVNTYEPVFVFCNRVDRLTRERWAMQDFVFALRKYDTHFGATWKKIYEPGDERENFLWEGFDAAHREAAVLPYKSRRGQRSGTGDRMEGGIASYAAASTVPPGFHRIKIRPDGVVIQQIRVDTPLLHPENPHEAFTKIYRDGKVVDQAGLVKWFWSTFGKPGWGVKECATELIRRGFTSPGLTKNKTGRSFADVELTTSEAWRVLRPLRRNMHRYRSCEIVVRYGNKKVKNTVITNCGFTDGVCEPTPWATDEDFDRAAAYWKERRKEGVGKASLSFVGVPVHSKFGEGCLRAAPEDRDSTRLGYIVARTQKRSERKAGNPVRPSLRNYEGISAIPHSALAESVVQGMERQAEKLWPAFLTADDPDVAAARVKLDHAELEVARLEAELDALVYKQG